jgi:3-hydroxyacyl-[acyl-carrier-protein] dehydratase
MRFAGSVSVSHPALPGHFPGRPIVPGVVLLTEIERAIAEQLRAEVVEWPQVKFLSPLKPGERYTIEIKFERDHARFRIESNGAAIASGTLRTTARA